jgi:hypothetical protein
MPLFVFLILGILQLGLIAQARMMAKYAAYRAVRVGAMHNASVDAMEAAAIFHLLPVLANASGTILPTNSQSGVISKYGRMLLENRIPPAKMVRAVICGPVQADLRGSGTDPLVKADQKTQHGLGSANEVDFDDTRLARAGEFGATGRGVRTYNRLRLRVQLQFLYRMPIPFANWTMTRIYIGSQLPAILRMSRSTDITVPKFTRQANEVRILSMRNIYALPINVSYAMRMQSNFFLNRYRLPSNNDCIHYRP